VFVIHLKSSDLASLAPHRHRDGWEIAVADGETCFLKAPLNPQTEEQLAHLPSLMRWTLEHGNQLVPLDKQLPDSLIPDLPWLPLASLLPLTTTRLRENEAFFGHLGFALIQTSTNTAPSALFLDFNQLAAWAETAPEPRLTQLKFAVSDSGQALIIGTPLPPLPGKTFHQNQRLLIPSGLALPDFILAQDITRDAHLTLIDQDGMIHHISQELLLPASRSTIRTTALAL
jgi:hypothetical protein